MFANKGEIAEPCGLPRSLASRVPSSCCSGAFQPPLHVEEDPPLACVVRDRAQDERVVERVEERPQIEIDHPVVSPTALPAAPHRLQGRASRPVPVRVRMEARLHLRLQIQAHDRLRDPVGDRGHTEHPRPAAAFRDLDRLHGRRHVAPRAEPIPELVEVPRQVRLERLDRRLVDTGSSLVGLHPQPRLPEQPLRNRKRLALRLQLAHRLLPRDRGWPLNKPGWPAPFAPPALPGLTATTGRSAPVPRIGTRPLTVSAAWGSPFHARPQADAAPLAVRGRGTTGSHVPHRSPDQARATSMPDTTWPISRHPPGSSRTRTPGPVSMPPISFRHVISGSLTLAFLAHT